MKEVYPIGRQKASSLLHVIVFGAVLLALVLTSIVISRGQAVPAFSAGGAAPAASVLTITEVMSSNQSAIVDPKGGYADWCEFQNTSSETLNLSHFGLSNDLLKPGKWGFPSMELKPGEYALVWLGGKAEVDERYPLFCAFKLSAGETLYLFDSSGNVLDMYKVESSESNVSYIREGAAFTRCETPTPGYANTEAGYEAYRAANRVENSDLLINEIVAKNTLTIPDENGAYHDWIELYNRGAEPILLTGYGLSDDPKAPMQWVFPSGSIGPGEYLVVYASGQDRHAEGQRFHTSFSLSAGGETVTLSDNLGRQLDQTTYTDLPDNAAWARIPGGDEWEIRAQPTPEKPNTLEGARAIQEEFFKKNPGLYLSEASNNNVSAFKEPGGTFPDWAELYNATAEPIDLAGYGLSDDPERPLLWKFPEGARIGPGEYLVVSLSRDPAVEGLRAEFGLSQLGEMLVLATPDRVVIDYMAVPRLQVNMSYGRGAGQSGFFYYDKSTPGAENGPGYEGYAPDAVPDVQPGVYAGAQTVSLSAQDDFGNPMDAAAGVQIFYTLDGTEPTRGSTAYQGPIEIPKTTALRVRSYREGYLSSPIETYTYIVGENHTMPIISLVTEPDNLFSASKGIYADGPNYMEEFPHGYDGAGANYWMDWERPAHVEMYEPDGQKLLSQDAGIKISGQYSRTLDQKSFMVVARNAYGDNRFRAKLFPHREFTEYQSFILRSSAQDYNRARMRDALLTGLMDETDVDYQDSQPVVVYINGKYWGHYNLRERINKHFAAQHQGYENPDEVDLLKGNSRELNGTNDEYLELIQYCKSHNLADPEALKYVTDRVDVQNYFDYQIAEIITGNTDLGNIKYYKGNAEGAKWRWVLYDLDWAFTGSTLDWDPFKSVLNPKGNGVDNMFDNTLIRKLLENAEMKKLFLDRLAFHMNNTFALSRVIDRIDALEKQMEPEMARHYERWPEDGSVTSWHRQVEYLRDYARKRPDIVLRAAKKYFELSTEQMTALFGRDP